MNRLGILSGCDHERTFSSANHQFYAEGNGLIYINDIAPTKNSGFNYKLEKISKFLSGNIFEAIFWLDDDAFFMQQDKSLLDFLDTQPDSDLIFCESPINYDESGQEIWTYISSGNFFIRNTDRARQFIDECSKVPLDRVEDWWDQEKFGLFTNGDQDAMVYLLHEDSRFNVPGFYARLPWQDFNARPFHFTNSPDQYFIAHFTGQEKQQQVLEFAARFGLSPGLIPQEAFDAMHGIRGPISSGQSTSKAI